MPTRFYRINYGYRALIDWAPTARIASGQMATLERGSSNLEGPFDYPGSKSRPLDSQITSSTIPGHRGIYWDIYNWKRPSMKASDTTTRDEVLRGFDTLAQQWIYLAAEKGNQSMQMAFDEEKIQALEDPELFGDETMESAAGMGTSFKDYRGGFDRDTVIDSTLNTINTEQDNLRRFFGTTDPGMGRMGQSMYQGSLDNWGGSMPNIFQNISESEYTSLPKHVGNRGIGPRGEYDYGGRPKQRTHVDNWGNDFDTTSRHFYDEQRPGVPLETVPMQLQQMVRGATDKTSWLAQWSQTLQRRGVGGIRILQEAMDRYMRENLQSVSEAVAYSAATHGSIAGQSYEKQQLGRDESAGATIQERVAVLTGAAVSPSDAQVPRHVAASLSKPIDLNFHNPITVDGLDASRFDVTTSTYQAQTGHHGTPFAVSQGILNATTVVELRDAVWEDYNGSGGLIQNYNNMIELLMGSSLATTTTGQSRGMQAVRSQVRGMGTTRHGGSAAGRTQIATDTSFGSGQVAELARINRNLQGRLGDAATAVAAMSEEDLIFSLSWALHHMGQPTPEDFGNMMRIDLPDGSQGTLLVAFDIDSNGRFSEAFVRIESGLLPIEFIYNHAGGLQTGYRLEQVIEMANAGHATGALEGTIVEGVYGKFAATTTLAFEPRIAWGKISPARYSEILERITTAVFEQIGQNAQMGLRQDLHAAAVQFSTASREPAELGAIPQWYMYAFRHMTGEDLGSLGSDPFWYLWAAPYITGEYPQYGGGTQQEP